MEQIQEKIKTILELMGLRNARITLDESYRKISIFIDDEFIQSQVERILPALDHVCNLLLRKDNLPSYVVDLNLYRKERERLITELARAAAHKAAVRKESVELPPMNAYERRIVHMELADKPDLVTESIGDVPVSVLFHDAEHALGEVVEFAFARAEKVSRRRGIEVLETHGFPNIRGFFRGQAFTEQPGDAADLGNGIGKHIFVPHDGKNILVLQRHPPVISHLA